MITLTWWLNIEFTVGSPRRRAEWSTESSCTSDARCISSTTAASVITRDSDAPSTSLASSASVGRNILPRICSR